MKQSQMSKTEAAEIIVGQYNVCARKYGWTGKATKERIAITISEMIFESGNAFLVKAARVRPTDRYIMLVGKRMYGNSRPARTTQTSFI